MVVGASADHLVAALHQLVGEGAGGEEHLLLILGEGGRESLAEGHGLGGDDVFERAALHAGEDGRVEQLRHHLCHALGRFLAPGVLEVLAHQDYAAAGAAQSLVGGGGDDVGVFDGVVEQAGGDEAGGVCHVDHQDGADFVGQAAHAGIVPLAAVGAGAAHDELGALAACHFLHVVVVHKSGFGIHVIF